MSHSFSFSPEMCSLESVLKGKNENFIGAKKLVRMDFDKNLIYSPKFAYLFGYFAADGCFYKDCSGYRFEFCDGTSVKKELHYSLKFIKSIRKIIKDLTGIIASVRKRDNKFILSFRNKKFAEFLINNIGLKAGVKTYTIDIPDIFRNSKFEKFFWVGFMDGDGMIARGSRKISVEVKSKSLIYSFKTFLDRNKILYHYFERVTNRSLSYKVSIGSNFIYDYYYKIGFLHPRKKEWLQKHLKKNDFYIENKTNFRSYILEENIFDYAKIFNSKNVFIVDGKKLLEKIGLARNGGKNRRFLEIFEKLFKTGLCEEEIFRILSCYRWKMSKGSTISVKLPLRLTKDIKNISKVVRFNVGGIKISRQYIQSLNQNPQKILKTFIKLFDVKPKYTCKKEPLFCSGVLKLFFSKFITRKYKFKEIKKPKWQEAVIC